MASQQEDTSKKGGTESNDANESKLPPSAGKNEAGEPNNLDQSTQLTCDVLCSLMSSGPAGASCRGGCPNDEGDGEGACDGKLSCGGMGEGAMLCSKQMQLPMFLSKTYHMISRSDPSIACWSESGDNFVIKDVDKFSASVLPLYFKHSNFSSFARQLNFYGFRKMRSDPILTSDVDPQTAGHVRFFHASFQRDKPDLLQHIKRATKTDLQSKDEIDSLRQEVASLREALSATTTEYERRLAELSYDFNRRLSATTVEFDNLVATVHRLLSGQGGAASVPAVAVEGGHNDPGALHSLSRIASLHQDRAAASDRGAGSVTTAGLQSPILGGFNVTSIGSKRAAEGVALPAPGASRPRLG